MRIDLMTPTDDQAHASHHEESKIVRAVGDTGDPDEHIASMPDINNDSMVGDLNQLINDLNAGKSASGRRPV